MGSCVLTIKGSGIVLSIFLLCEILMGITAMKLNKQSILLNYLTDLPTNYTLYVRGAETDDCFKWRTSNEYMVEVTPLYTDSDRMCSKKAIVSVVGGYDSAIRIARVTAIHEENSNIKFYCNVYTDEVTSIELISYAGKIFIDEPLVDIKIIAKNEQGHVFSSINGMLFKWEAQCDPKDSLIFRMQQETDGALSNDDPWEMTGMLSSSVFLDPIKEGTCIIKAKWESIANKRSKTESEILSTNEHKIYIAPRVQVYPSSDVYILQNSTINLQFRYIDGQKFEVDKNLSNFQSMNPGITIISKELTKITGVMIGTTTLIYENSHINVPKISVNVHVVEPDSLEIDISNGGSGILEEMKTYKVTVFLKAGNKRIAPTDTVRINVKFSSKLFYIINKSENGTYYLVQTLAPGVGGIKAEYIGNYDSKNNLIKGKMISSALKIRVCNKLKIFPPHFFVPFHEKSDPLHEIPLQVSGGTLKYSIGVNNPFIGSVTELKAVSKTSSEGIVNIKKGGILRITATDENNINMKAVSTICIAPVLDVEVFPSVVETTINNTLLLPVALLGLENIDGKSIYRKFDDCSKVLPTVEIIEKHVLVLDEYEKYVPAFGKGCLTMQFRCKNSGYSRVNIYVAQNKSDPALNFKTTTVLSCFKPLRPVHPVRVAVLPLYSEKHIAAEGGPRTWPLKKENFYVEMEASKPDLIRVELIKDPIRYNRDLQVFKAVCINHGETELTFKIGNKASATLPHPAKAEAKIKLVCSDPISIHLKVHKTSERARREEPENLIKVPFYGEKKFSLDIWLKDNVGRKFANISSLEIEWQVSDEKLAVAVDSNSGFQTFVNGVAGYQKITRDFKEFDMSGETGDLKITAKVTGYKPEVLKRLNIKNTPKFKEISKTIDLKLVSLRDVHEYQITGVEEKENKACIQGSNSEGECQKDDYM